MKYAVFLVGAAGSGKTTLASVLLEHYSVIHRVAHVINLDPAVNYLPFQPAADIRDLVTAYDIQDYLTLGPNASLIYAVQHFVDENHQEIAEIFNYEDDFLLLDCPGQIELFVYFDCFKVLGRRLARMGYELGCCYLIEAQKAIQRNDRLGNTLVAAAVRSALGMPFLQVYSKCDICEIPEPQDASGEYEERVQAVVSQSETVQYSCDDEQSITELAQYIDFMIHYGEE